MDRRYKHLRVQPSPKLEIFNFIWTGDIFNFQLTGSFRCLVEGRMCSKPSSCITSYENLVRFLPHVGKIRNMRGLVLYDDSIQVVEIVDGDLYVISCSIPFKIDKKMVESLELEKLRDILFMHDLKFVTIELISQAKNELELIKYLLEHLNNLLRMTLLYAPPLPLDVSREITEYEKASFHAEVDFRPI
ncbi:hypothetical protein L484_028040 [Morus notabilis]|uniref:FBD domain-containing protein n=1 Tax=Morus notabilis TaxID=981085 RepID=W9S7Z8_9ROSA|nr:hypothetical protein L484_028040 [Morus notabilis]